MATKKQHDRVGALIAEVEALAKRLRTDIRKRAEAAGVLKSLRTLAEQLRKRAAKAAAQVENYVHELRKELEAASRAGKKPAKRKRLKASPHKAAAGVPPLSM